MLFIYEKLEMSHNFRVNDSISIYEGHSLWVLSRKEPDEN